MAYFVCWDVESTDRKLNGFTQVISISAILCNDKFEEVDRVENEICRLNKFCIPAAAALLVNSFDPNDKNWQQKQSSYDMVKNVSNTFSKWVKAYGEIIWIAYNSNFDTSLWRNAQYVNLYLDNLFLMNTLPCSEMDALKFAHMLGSFSEEMKVPFSDDGESAGRKSFKLEGLAQENNIEILGSYHDSLTDCLVLKDFISKFKKTNPELFQALLDTSHKTKATKVLEQSKDFITSLAWFKGRQYLYPMSFVGISKNNPNEAILIDLREVDESLLEYDYTQIRKAFDKQKNKPIRRLWLNKNPIILNSSYFSKKTDDDNSKITVEEAHKRHQMVQNNSNFKNRLMNVAYDINEENPFPKDWEFAETAIYCGDFFNNNHPDYKNINLFHEETVWNNKRKIVKGFHDPRFVELANNLIFTNEPSVFSDNERKRIGSRIANRIMGMSEIKKQPFNTIPGVQSEIDDLRLKNEDIREKLEHLESYDKYLEDLKSDLEEYL